MIPDKLKIELLEALCEEAFEVMERENLFNWVHAFENYKLILQRQKESDDYLFERFDALLKSQAFQHNTPRHT